MNFRSASHEYHCFTVLPWIVIISTYPLASMRNFICSFWSFSSTPVLVLILKGNFIIHESFFISANVCFLSFNKALHHQVFMTFLAGQPIFNSIHENTFPYFFWMSEKHFINISSFAQKICAIIFFWFLSVKRCLMTPVGLMIYPSAFMNSVRKNNLYFPFSPYSSKISFTIWRKAQSVNQSMGANQSIIVNTVQKAEKISSRKKALFSSL